MRGLTAIGIVCLVISAWLIWIKAPISGGANPSLSFGWLAGVIGGVAGIAWLRRAGSLLAIAGVTGVALCSFSLLHLALSDPALWSLVDENTQAANMIVFSNRFLPGNFGISPTFQSTLPTESLIDRVAAAFYFMSWGWWLCFIGSLLLLVGSAKCRDRVLGRWVTAASIAIFTSQGFALAHAVGAQYLQEKGERDIALGRYAQAIERYRRAQQWSPQLATSEQAHRRLGSAYYQLGIASYPHARFSLGDRYAQERHFQAAIAEYVLAAEDASPALKEIIDKRLAWTYVDRGMAQYRKGEVGPAIGRWEQALTFDVAQVQAAYFLAKAYLDQGRYEQSIAMSRFVLSRSQNRLLNANMQTNIGDNYWKLHDFNRARMAYEASLRLDSYANFRIFKSLGGT